MTGVATRRTAERGGGAGSQTVGDVKDEALPTSSRTGESVAWGVQSGASWSCVKRIVSTGGDSRQCKYAWCGTALAGARVNALADCRVSLVCQPSTRTVRATTSRRVWAGARRPLSRQARRREHPETVRELARWMLGRVAAMVWWNGRALGAYLGWWFATG